MKFPSYRNSRKAQWLGLCVSVFPVAFISQAMAAGSAADCKAITDNSARLACYDALSGRADVTDKPATNTSVDQTAAHTNSSPDKPKGEQGLPPPVPEYAPIGRLISQHWELDPEEKNGLFHFVTHHANYVLPGVYDDNVNNHPYSPTHAAANPNPGDYQKEELKFQVSFKTKILEDILFGHADLWAAYTQQSNWQVYNSADSRPFRETNYEPEAILAFPTNYDLFGLHGRFIDLAFDHQSNGQADPLSRSWNRVYAQIGFDRGDFALQFRRWWRLSDHTDDNPDITHYLGHGDLVAAYKRDGNMYILTVRNNLDSDHNHGAVQFDWTFPLYLNLKGYVQLFSGYGDSLIDYNHRQNTVGLGVMLTDWL